MLRFLPAGLLILLVLSPGCRVSTPDLFPLPEQIEGVEGYASLKVSSQGETTRSRFSFIFHFPDLGRIDVTDFFGKSLFLLYFKNGTAYIVVPAKKLYWQGDETEAVAMFLGFKMKTFDFFALMIGRWGEEHGSYSGPEGSWEFQKDERGRVSKAVSGDLRFEVEEHFDRSFLIRDLAFTHLSFDGRIRILRIGFDPYQGEDTYTLDFLENYDRTTWEEMRETFDHKD